MPHARDALFAQVSLLQYLRSSRTPRTVREILTHLHNNTDWGRAQLTDGPPDKGLRNLQNWLKAIRESAEFGQQIEWEEDPADRRQFRYRSRLPAAAQQAMPIEEACTLLMAEKFLDAALPADFYEQSLQDLFRTARSVLAKYEQRPKHAKRQVAAYLDRIAVAQRGQQLVQEAVPYDVLAVISRAMLDGKCIACRYNGKSRVLHPYALVLKSPKIYLLAVDDRRLEKNPAGTHEPVQFVCSRITNARVSDRLNRVPDDFRADRYLQHSGMDVELGLPDTPPGRRFTLKLRIHDGARDNLLRDLEEFPLSPKQTIDPEPGTPNHLLTAPGLRASHQLMEWIAGRLDRVEVLAPKRLRNEIASRIAAMHRLYASD